MLVDWLIMDKETVIILQVLLPQYFYHLERCWDGISFFELDHFSKQEDKLMKITIPLTIGMESRA
jgi:hypothetical protein